LVSHKHIMVNDVVVNIPSYQLKPGDVVTVADKSKENEALKSLMRPKNPKIGWVDFNEAELTGTFVAYPERENVPENIKEQLIVELYSK
jgi:small subunit ribosomal protein S4